MLQIEKECNEDRLKEMDRDVQRLDRKELIHEKSLIEQCDNIERKIDYEVHKNQKI